MSASLVGSEMCIRDRFHPLRRARQATPLQVPAFVRVPQTRWGSTDGREGCLLYTSDAADDM
eukprot:2811548-Alexandrium_andersonii.AAC.1